MELDRESIDRYVDIAVKGQAPDLKIPQEACVVNHPVEPCSIVIFGATGDLTTRKLGPSLYNLFVIGGFPESFVIMGAARSEMSDEQFRDRLKEGLADTDLSRWDDFASHLYYHRIDLRSVDSFKELFRYSQEN